MRYVLGSLVVCDTEFRNAPPPKGDGALIDPTIVHFEYSKPDGTVTSLRYGVDLELKKDAVGKYHVNLDAQDSGVWAYRWWSEGLGQAATEGRFTVVVSMFEGVTP
jgi:hypothetical protein